MTVDHHLKEEYTALRNEIDQNSQIVATVFLANISVTAAIIGFGLNAKNGLVLLCPFAILIPSMFFIVSKLESTTRIASYIRVVLEPELGLRWQSHWREIRRKKLLPSRRKYVASISSLYCSLCVVCAILAYVFWTQECWLYLITIIPIAILVTLATIAMGRAFSGRYRTDYDAAWSKLSAEEKRED